MIQFHRQGFYIFFTLALSFLLASCSTGPSGYRQASSEQGLTPSARQTSDYRQSAEHYLKLAQENKPAKATEYRVLAADMFAQAEDALKAESLLTQIDRTALSSEMRLRLACTEAQLYLLKGQAQTALAQLPTPSAAMQGSQDIQRRYLTLKALAHTRLNQTRDGVQARLQLDSLLVDPSQVRLNRAAIWEELNDLPNTTLTQLSSASRSKVDRGWYQLALINQQYDTRPAILSEQFAQWRHQYPTHPGNEVLPNNVGISTARTMPTQPRQIALLLPTSGKLSGPANAIRDGFLASYYQANGRANAQPQVKVYDTSRGNPQQLYQQAMREGADFVVGPLSKQNVLALGQMSEIQMRVPVLALNHNDQLRNPSEQFYQFSLSPENEANLVASKALSDGHRRAAIVVPNNSWGRRIASAFQSSWRSRGGQIVKTVEIDPKKDQSAAIRALLNIDESHKRAKEINGLLGTKVKFEPRRREDIDVILMAAAPEQARQLRPLFNFYYAEDLPVYATSSIYSGTPNPAKDRDMNGIIFCDMPWVIDNRHPSQSARQSIQSGMPGANGQYQRLYAMGADAFVLTSQLSRLTHYQSMGVPAATGTLYLGRNHQIERRLKWAKIQNGVPRAL